MSGWQRKHRRAGMLMHISSLPGPYGIGEMGNRAVEFADLLAEAGIEAWQLLPLVPTDPATYHSPYSSPSAFAGNTLFIDSDGLAALGLVGEAELAGCRLPSPEAVDWEAVSEKKKALLFTAYDNFRREGAYRTIYKTLSDDFWNFCVREAYWLEDYALFNVLKEMEEGVSWGEWRPAFRMRDWRVLDPLKQERDVARKLDICRFSQFLFFLQLEELRCACRNRGIELIGDLPIYVAYDSADVWAHQELFELDGEGRPTCVAGVPPDYFSPTGQRWGNPIYRWDRMREDGYGWWLGRIHHALRYADVVRIDHFRGLMGYWEIAADEPTAVNGIWKPGPGTEFLQALYRRFAEERGGELPFIAEDLGVMTDDVYEAMEAFDLPGMKVLQFAFGQGMPQNPYAPHNHRRNCVVYVGTHDNNTTAGWWEGEATEPEKANFLAYVGRPELSSEEAADLMIRLALASTANLAVLAAQDVLRLGESARMNTPSTVGCNWTWRLCDYAALRKRMGEIAPLLRLYGRHTRSEEETRLEDVVSADTAAETPDAAV